LDGLTLFVRSQISEIFCKISPMDLSRQVSRSVGAPPKTNLYSTSGCKTLRNVDDMVRGVRGEAVYRFRRLMGWNRGELARLIGVDIDSVVHWEFGDNEPKRLAWQAFCRVRLNYRRKMKRLGKDLDGGPVMGGN
jgi:DNA-binding XRE family transcriptional regulator